MIQLNRDKLVELLRIAFDEGWHGYKDLRDSAVEKLVADLEETQKKEVKAPVADGLFVSSANSPYITINTTGNTIPPSSTYEASWVGTIADNSAERAIQTDRPVFSTTTYGDAQNTLWDQSAVRYDQSTMRYANAIRNVVANVPQGPVGHTGFPGVAGNSN